MSQGRTIDLTMDDDDDDLARINQSQALHRPPSVKREVSAHAAPYNPPSTLNINKKDKRRMSVRKDVVDVESFANKNLKVGPPNRKKRRLQQPEPSSKFDADEIQFLGTTMASLNTTLPPPDARLRERVNTSSTSASRSQSATSRDASNSTQRPTPTRREVIELSDDDEPVKLPDAVSRRAAEHASSSRPPPPIPLPPRTLCKHGPSLSQTSTPTAAKPSPAIERGVFTRLYRTPPLSDRETVGNIISTEEYDRFHPGLDLDNPYASWKAMKTNEHKGMQWNSHAHEEASDSGSERDPDSEEEREHAKESRLAMLEQLRPPDVRNPVLGRSQPVGHRLQKDADGNLSLFCWNMHPQAINYAKPGRHHSAGDPTNKQHVSLPDVLDLAKLKMTAAYKMCPGGIIRVEQRHGWVAIAGGAIGGLPDETPNETPDNYNREGSLCIYFHRRKIPMDITQGHQANRLQHIKHFGVNDVKFFPVGADGNSTYVSSGNDHIVQVWGLQECHKHTEPGDNPRIPSIRHSRLHRFDGVPHALAFKPGTSTLAVAENAVYIFPKVEDKLDLDSTILPTKFGMEKAGQVVGEICWGSNSTSSFIFASSEPKEVDCFSGSWHRAFDIERPRNSYTFDASEAGDTIAIDTEGANLAIATRTSNSKGVLRMYDVRRKTRKAHARIDLEPFGTNIEGQVNDASFSSDGIYLALGRYDNRTHVYDARFLSDRGPLYDFTHNREQSQVSPGQASCGVMKVKWVESMDTGRLGLVTGGADGCVRLWDPLHATGKYKYGTILAQIDSDIGTFSLGDRLKGEHQLVVGDCIGGISIFDRKFDGEFHDK